MALARDRERIDHPLPADRHTPAAAKLAVDEREIEPGIVRDQRAVSQEIEQRFDRIGEQRFVGEESVADAVDRLRLGGNRALGMIISVEGDRKSTRLYSSHSCAS